MLVLPARLRVGVNPNRNALPDYCMHLIDSTAIVTGANRGIGLAVADRLAQLGAHVILAGRDVQSCRNAAGALAARGLQAEAYEASFDATEPHSTAAFGAFCASRGVDVLVNNAGVCDAGWSRECVHRTVRTNILAPREQTRAVLPGMLRRQRGCIINVSSGDGELVYLNMCLQDRMRSLGKSFAHRHAFCVHTYVHTLSVARFQR